MYSRISSTKSPVSGAGNIIVPTMILKVRRMREDVASISVLFYSQSGGGASIALLK
jgi:hypothetical protein